MALDLVVKTLRGSVELHGLGASHTIGQLKQLLHEQHKEGPLAVPGPQEQRLVRAEGGTAGSRPLHVCARP
jgi:hypothetical protein